ncbi:MAG: hypothetical protein HOC09_19360 [Deltaproteobacteria bacterium]|nr:hypothetical protein [Deltaproteobacteria bacterium]
MDSRTFDPSSLVFLGLADSTRTVLGGGTGSSAAGAGDGTGLAGGGREATSGSPFLRRGGSAGAAGRYPGSEHPGGRGFGESGQRSIRGTKRSSFGSGCGQTRVSRLVWDGRDEEGGGLARCIWCGYRPAASSRRARSC